MNRDELLKHLNVDEDGLRAIVLGLVPWNGYPTNEEIYMKARLRIPEHAGLPELKTSKPLVDYGNWELGNDRMEDNRETDYEYNLNEIGLAP